MFLPYVRKEIIYDVHFHNKDFNTSDFLMQQLIQGLQANNMAKMSTRHSRSLPDLLTTARVLHLIDNFPVRSIYMARFCCTTAGIPHHVMSQMAVDHSLHYHVHCTYIRKKTLKMTL